MNDLTPDQQSARSWLSSDHTPHDLDCLRAMWKRLLILRDEGIAQAPKRIRHNTVLQLSEPDGRLHRVVLSRFAELQALAECTFVGFFGLRRPGTHHLDLDLLRADEQLLAEFERNEHLLSYSSVQMKPRSGSDMVQWGNLVVFAQTDGIEHWRQGAFHQTVAVDVLSPKAYLAIRLHNGRVTGGFQDEAEFLLRGTKYYDYAE